LGVLGLACYAAAAVHEIWIGQPESLWWACYVGAAAVALGLLLKWPTWNAIGLLWLLLGVPLWIIELFTGTGCHFISAFPHLGGLALGLVGVRLLGLPQGVWWKAVAALYVLHWASRWLTPEQENINLAFRVWEGWEAYFPSHSTYILSLLTLACVLFISTEFVLRRTGFAGTAAGEPGPGKGRENEHAAAP